MTSAQGRDYNGYQKPVTLSMLTGLSFAYTRVSNWQPPDYTIPGVDLTFAGNWREIKAAGLHRGAYWYLLLDVDPAAQARFFFSAVVAAGLDPGDMLVCDSGARRARVPGAGLHQPQCRPAPDQLHRLAAMVRVAVADRPACQPDRTMEDVAVLAVGRSSQRRRGRVQRHPGRTRCVGH